MRNCLILAGVVLGGLFVCHNDTLVPSRLQHLRDWDPSVDEVVDVPTGIPFFLLTLIAKAKKLFGSDWIHDLTNSGQAWIGAKFLQLMKLLMGDLSSYTKNALTERLGMGTFASIWRLASTDLAVKAVPLPPVTEQPVWSGVYFDDTEDEFVSW